MNIVGRDQWGAAPPRSSSRISLPVAELWLHHSVSDTYGAEGVRHIQNIHLGKGWNDIGYSWVYCPRTRKVFEGRGAGVRGAHTSGRNAISHGLCLIGNFQHDRLSDQNIADLAEFAAWHGRHGPDEFTGGHRDVKATACPGDNAYARIGDINRRASDSTGQQEDDVIRRGDDGPEVAEWQERLVRWGEARGQDWSHLDTDGQFDAETEQFTVKWQGAMNLRETGRVGPLEWSRMETSLHVEYQHG